PRHADAYTQVRAFRSKGFPGGKRAAAPASSYRRAAAAAARRRATYHRHAAPLEPCSSVRAAPGGHLEAQAALGGRESHLEDTALLRARLPAADPYARPSPSRRGTRHAASSLSILRDWMFMATA